MEPSSSTELIRTITFWGYPTMFLLMALEGPLATLVSAFLASLGYFNIFAVFALSLVGDIVGDIFWYWAGKYSQHSSIKKILDYFGQKANISDNLKKQFKIRGAKIIFTAKATVGLGIITYILAGISQMPFRKFLTYSFLGGLVWSSALVFLGYTSGYAIDKINGYIEKTGYIVLLAIIVFILLYSLGGKKRAGSFFNFLK